MDSVVDTLINSHCGVVSGRFVLICICKNEVHFVENRVQIYSTINKVSSPLMISLNDLAGHGRTV